MPNSPHVFIHIFKSAGTSIQLQMRAKFGLDAVPKINDGAGFPGRVREALKDRSVDVLCGHFRYSRIASALEQTGYGTPTCFSFVRDPVDRLVSAYNYFRGNDKEKWHSEAARMDINEFIRFFVENDPDATVNHQCRMLSEQGEATFDAARESVQKNFLFVGCVEDIEATNGLALQHLGMAFDREYTKNVSPRHQGAKDLSRETLALIHEVTAEDRKLHSYLKDAHSHASSHHGQQNSQPTSRTFPADYYIVDVGMNDGKDSHYYAKRGFKVRAIEANPALVASAEEVFSRSGLDIEVTCAAVSDQPGELTFYVNKLHSVWSSLKPESGRRRAGANEIKVVSCNLAEALSDIADRLFYVKIDIEGYDHVALDQILKLPHLPRYVSVENGGRAMIESLMRSGYDRFKFYNQKFITRDSVPKDSALGNWTNHRFEFGSSGLFGDDVPGRWLSAEEALLVDEGLSYGRKIAPNNLWAESVGWFDLHAARPPENAPQVTTARSAAGRETEAGVRESEDS